MSHMFSGCRSLAELDLKSFDARQVIYMDDMFSGCSSLAALNTPVRVLRSASLPSGRKWYQDGTEVTELPQGLDYSVQLVGKAGTPEEKPSNPGTLPDTLAMDNTGVHIAVFCIFAALTLCACRLKKKWGDRN